MRQNAECGKTPIEIKQNTLLTADVITSDSNSLQVGSATATHVFQITSKYTFSSKNGKIELQLPPTLQMGSSLSCKANFLKAGADKIEVPLTIDSCTKTNSGSPIVVTIEYSYSSDLEAKGFTFSVSQFINPSQIQYSGDFSVKTYLNKNFISDDSKGITPFGFTTTPAPFNSAKLAISGNPSKIVYEQALYKLTLNSPVTMNTNDKLTVEFPTYVDDIDKISVISPSGDLRFISSSGQPLTLTLMFHNTFNGVIEVQFEIKNPPVTKKDYSVKVSAINSSGPFLSSVVIYGIADSIISTEFKQFSVKQESKINFAITKYTISMMPTTYLELSSYIYIKMSAPTTTHSFFTVSTICKYQNKEINCTPSPSTNEITIEFKNVVKANSQYEIVLENVINYISLAPFTMTCSMGYSKTQIGNESLQNLQNDTPKTEPTITLQIQEQLLGLQSNYIFTINNAWPQPNQGGVRIIATDQVFFQNPSTVQMNSKDCPPTSTPSQLEIPCFPDLSSTKLTIEKVNNPTKLITQTTTPFEVIEYEIVSGIKYNMKKFVNTASPLIFINQCDTTSFCEQCEVSNKKNCITCYKKKTIYYQFSSEFVEENILDTTQPVPTCVKSCPNGRYETNDKGRAVCYNCLNNCNTCETSSNKCTSCIGIYYLYQDQCLTICPTKYYKSTDLKGNNICQQCSLVGYCDTCTDAGVCQTCQPSYLKQDQQCVTACSQGYYVNNTFGLCEKCPTGCSKCDSSTVCQACIPNYIKYSDICVSTCPQGTSKLLKNNEYYCSSCDANCKTCENIQTSCTSCSEGRYLYRQMKQCILEGEIPKGFYGDKSTWTVESCSASIEGCEECSFKTSCAKCLKPTLIYKGKCYSDCPEDTVSDGIGGCKEAYVPAALSENSKVVPFPMLLSCIAFCISVYFSKYEKPQTFVPGCIVGFCAIFEWISWIILVGITFSNDGATGITTVIAIIGFITVYLFNILSFVAYKRIIVPDASFIDWSLIRKNQICKNVSIILALIFSFKIQKILFCKYFNQQFFKAKLKDIDIFSTFNKISILSVFFNSFLIILSSAYFSYNYQNSTQLFILSLDTLLVTLFMIIFMIWEALKNENFFDETYHVNHESMSQFTQRFFPFDQSYLEKAKQKSVYGHLQRADSNSHLNEFGQENKVTKTEQLQKPYSQVMDPNDISNNAALDRNVLENSHNGAPYLIQDEISEKHKPGRKRQFEKKHIAPVFDYQNYPPIEENSLEDEDEDYYNENSPNQTMKKMVNKNGSIMNKSIGSGEYDDLKNHSNIKSNGQNNKAISIDDEDLENQQNNLKNKLDQINNSVYYDPSSQIVDQNKNEQNSKQNDEKDIENQRKNSQLKEGNTIDQYGNIVDKNGKIIEKQSYIVDKNGNIIDKNGNIVDKNGNIIEKNVYSIDKNGNIIDKDGKIVGENIVGKNGNTIDKNGNIIDKDGNIIEKNAYTVDKNGKIIDKNGNIVDKNGKIIEKNAYKVDKNGNIIDKNGKVIGENIVGKNDNTIDKNGNIIDKDGNIIEKNAYTVDKNGNIIDKNGNIVDKNGNIIEKNAYTVDKNGNIIDKNGQVIGENIVGKNGNTIDKNGNLVDKNGNTIEKNAYTIDKNGKIIDKNGNIVDKNGNIIEKNVYSVDKNGNIIDKEGKVVGEDIVGKNGNTIDKNGNIIDKDGNIIEKNAYTIDKQGNIIDKNGNIVDKNGKVIEKNAFKVDKNGNIIDKDGKVVGENIVGKNGNTIDKNGNIVDKNGNIIEKNAYAVDKNGKIIDKNGNVVDKNGNIIEKNAYSVDKNGNIIDKDGKVVDENIVGKNGNSIDKNGNIIDKDGNIIEKNAYTVDKNGNIIDKNGNIVDKNGNIVKKNSYKVDKNGNIIDKDGKPVGENIVGKNGNTIDKDGNILDKDGNILEKNAYTVDKNGNIIDKDGNIIDKNGNIIQKNAYTVDKNGNFKDNDGNIIDKNGNTIDKDGNIIDKDGNILDKNGNIIGSKNNKDKNSKDDKNKKSPTSNKPEDMQFYFNNPLDENQDKKDENSNKDNQKDKGKDGKKGDENTKVEKIMPDVEDLDKDANKQSGNPKNEKGKNLKMNTPNDQNQKDKDKLKRKGPQKNNLFGVSDDEVDESKGASNKKKNKSSKKEKNNIYDSDESLHTASEAEMNFNEVSPSDFNILNQRYEEDFFVQPPQSALQMQLLQQSLSQLKKGNTTQSQQNILNNMSNTNYDVNSQTGQYGLSDGVGNDERNYNSSGLNHKKAQSSNQKQNPLNSSNSNASLNSMNNQQLLNKSQSPQKKQRNLNLVNSRSQNVNGLSVDMKQNTMPNGNNSIGQNSNNFQNFINQNPDNQLVIENFEDFNNTSSQSQFQGVNGSNAYGQTQQNPSLDPRHSYQYNKGNMSNRSKNNTSNSNITYKVPAVDVNKLKNLEKIYLQRIETNVGASHNSTKNPMKKKKKKIQRDPSQNSNLQIHHGQGRSPGEMSEMYFGERQQAFDPSVLDNQGGDGIDFDDDEDYGPDNVNFDQNF